MGENKEAGSWFDLEQEDTTPEQTEDVKKITSEDTDGD